MGDSDSCEICNPPAWGACPECGYVKDTPNHELGCDVGRKEYGHD